MKHSKEKYIFECDKGHEFEAALNHISNNSFCNRCPFQNESYCIGIIENLTNKNFRKIRLTFLNSKLELDGYNKELELALEYNGEQHYKYVHKFYKDKINALEKQQERDKLKAKLCKENGIYLIVVPYYEKDKEEYIKREYNNYLELRKQKKIIKKRNKNIFY